MYFAETLMHLLEVRRKSVGQAVAVVLPSAVRRSRYGCPIPEESRSSATKMPAAELATVTWLILLKSHLTQRVPTHSKTFCNIPCYCVIICGYCCQSHMSSVKNFQVRRLYGDEIELCPRKTQRKTSRIRRELYRGFRHRSHGV